MSKTMAKSKRKDSSSTTKLSKLGVKERGKLVAEWNAKLETKDDAERSLNLHAVMCDANKLRTQHTGESVDAALSEIFPDRSKRARLKRLHEIDKGVLRRAMTTYRKTRKNEGYKDSMCTLGTTHLEFLGGCKDAEKRIDLLYQCASEGWTVIQIKAAVKAGSGSETVRPLDLAKQIRTQTKRLAKLLQSVTEEALLESVTKVKVHDQKNAATQLLAAAKELTTLRNQLKHKSDSFRAAHKALKRLA